MYDPMAKDIKSLVEQVKSLEAQLKEKEMQREEEQLYKISERKKVDILTEENNQLKKQLGFHIAFNKNGKDKIIPLIEEVLKYYGKRISDKTN